MDNGSGRPFEYSFTNDSGRSYLVLDFSNGIEPFSHQVEIINQNPCSAFVPFHIRCKDEFAGIYYNITSKISLSQYLERKQLNKKELLDLLRSINGSLLLHSNYLLDLSGFLLDKHFIYINPATAEVSLIYIPISNEIDALDAYKTFLKDLIVNSASVDDNARDNYLQRILNYFKSDAFSLVDFNRLIMDLRNSGGLNEPFNKPIQGYRSAADGEKAVTNCASTGKSHMGKQAGKTEKSRQIFGIVLVQLLIILAAAIAWLFLLSQSMADMASALGIFIIAAAFDFLIINRLTGKRIRQHAEIEEDTPKAPLRPGRSVRKDSPRITPKPPDILRACDTVMISESSEEEYVYLEGVGIHKGEKAIINKKKFVVGRLGSMVDHIVQDSTVGKLHAEITERDGAYCIRDLNSKNGTYINDERIPSNNEYEIKPNDRIRFSNFEYVFKQQKTL